MLATPGRKGEELQGEVALKGRGQMGTRQTTVTITLAAHVDGCESAEMSASRRLGVFGGRATLVGEWNKSRQECSIHFVRGT